MEILMMKIIALFNSINLTPIKLYQYSHKTYIVYLPTV